MTWLFICVILVPSFLLGAEGFWFQAEGMFWEPRSFREGSGEVRQMRFYWVCWVEAWLSQPGCSPAPHNSHLPDQMQLVLLEAGQNECGGVPSSQRSSTWMLGQSGRDGPPSIWSLTAVAITPLGSNYCLELMTYWLANYLLDWHFSKGFINGSRCAAATVQGHGSEVGWG